MLQCNIRKEEKLMKLNLKEHIGMLSKHLRRHSVLMIIATSIVSLVALLFAIYWEFDPNDLGDVIDYFYLGASIFFVLMSVSLTVLLVLARFDKLRTNFLTIFIHIYVFLLVAMATVVCIFDLKYGFSPVFFLTVLLLVAGLFVVEPLFFGITLLASSIVVIVFAIKDGAAFFSGAAGVENIITFIAYLVIVLLVGGEHFGITINDYRIEKRLEQLTYFDDLTGLLNERSYLKEIEELDKLIEQKKLKEYAVILMDVNNIKVTNDTYGHRYGCHLIVRCGKTLPKHFTSSSLFHIGGDEFVAIVYGDDYKRLDEILKTYDDTLSFSMIEFEGHELVFSVAYGVAKYEEGMRYKDVLQKADNAMYVNKKAVKEKYGLKMR